jgi:RimJ/RimL family protein N-acetyltransferase
VFDTGEIGYTWLTASAIRTAANSEAKLLMLTHAFEVWKMCSVHLCTDERNERSASAILRIGAKFEGVLRAHRMAADFTPRNTKRFSIVAEEWPEVKRGLQEKLARTTSC